MKVFAVIIAGLAAAVCAQSPTSNSPPSTTSIARTPQQTCLDTCAAGDRNCQAACVGVPHPNELNANQTTACVARCDQGDGSPDATRRYGECINSCVQSYFPISGTVAPGSPGATGGAASSAAASATGSAASAASSAASAASGAASSAASSASGAAASATRTGAASANGVTFGAASFGSLLMALFAM